MILLIISQVGSVAGNFCFKSFPNNKTLYTLFAQFYRVALRGNFVHGSVSLSSNSGNGNITISGIPAGANVVKAFLFWVDEDNNNASGGNFNGNPISGIKIAEDCTSCWGTQRNALFYADVTGFVTGNGTYSLSGFPALVCFFGSDGSEGATLVVIWCENSEPVRTITIYTGDVETPASVCTYSSYSWTHTGFTASNPVLDAKYLVLVGNGQNFGESSSEYVYLNGNMITNIINGTTVPGPGPCGNGSLWDAFSGSATSWIAPNSTSATFSVNNVAAWDCWHPVVSVLSVTSLDPITYNCATPVSISESENLIEIKNFNEFLYITSKVHFGIFNVNGQLIKYFNEGEYKLNLKKGIYFIKYEVNKRVNVEKIIVK